MTCQCTHLTNFSVGRQNIAKSVQPVVEPVVDGHNSILPFWAIIVIAVVGGTVLIVAVIIIVIVMRRRSKVSDDVSTRIYSRDSISLLYAVSLTLVTYVSYD